MAAKPKANPFEPWRPPVLSLADVVAIQKWSKGDASPEQQRRAARIVIEQCCRTYQETFCPGADGERDSVFAQGMRRVGTMLVSFINADLKNFRDPGATPREND